MAFQRR
jgi:hypothetical protein